MNLKTVFAILLASFACLCSAKPPFLRVFMETYNISPDSAIGKARCLNCHLPPGPPKRNPFGLAVASAMEDANSRVLTADILRTVEGKDAGNGMTFLAKIKADLPPGEPVPAKPTPSPKPAPKPVSPKAGAKTPAKPAKVTAKAKPKRRSHKVRRRRRALLLPSETQIIFALSVASIGAAFVGLKKSEGNP